MGSMGSASVGRWTEMHVLEMAEKTERILMSFGLSPGSYNYLQEL